MRGRSADPRRGLFHIVGIRTHIGHIGLFSMLVSSNRKSLLLGYLLRYAGKAFLGSAKAHALSPADQGIKRVRAFFALKTLTCNLPERTRWLWQNQSATQSLPS